MSIVWLKSPPPSPSIVPVPTTDINSGCWCICWGCRDHCAVTVVSVNLPLQFSNFLSWSKHGASHSGIVARGADWNNKIVDKGELNKAAIIIMHNHVKYEPFENVIHSKQGSTKNQIVPRMQHVALEWRHNISRPFGRGRAHFDCLNLSSHFCLFTSSSFFPFTFPLYIPSCELVSLWGEVSEVVEIRMKQTIRR